MRAMALIAGGLLGAAALVVPDAPRAQDREPGVMQRPREPAVAQEAGHDPEAWRRWRGVLFRVQPPGGHGDDTVSFLFGTLHFGSAAELGLDTDVVFEALGHMRRLVNEVDNQAPWDPDMDRYRLLPGKDGLRALIGAPAFGALAQLLPDVSPAWLSRLKPWAALALLEARGETAGDQLLDLQLERRAAAAGLAVEHLETLREQLAALDCVPAVEHAPVLEQRLRTPWLFAEDSARTLEYYRTRDLAGWMDDVDAMEGLDARGRAAEQQARRCLIEDRNARWLPRLDALLRRGGVFVAVGAIHLTGAAGLLEQLRRRGFSIVAEPL
ncbi:TraB/GumN family protein [Pigmentiphaga soli]|uniref:TraB/GumN family protein n=2 Tax=Pigmentiphaga soli TaxID=1007095 RepID=A0ABP8H3K0_9BURK